MARDPAESHCISPAIGRADINLLQFISFGSDTTPQ
jgi:hypothetical protein